MAHLLQRMWTRLLKRKPIIFYLVSPNPGREKISDGAAVIYLDNWGRLPTVGMVYIPMPGSDDEWAYTTLHEYAHCALGITRRYDKSPSFRLLVELEAHALALRWVTPSHRRKALRVSLRTLKSSMQGASFSKEKPSTLLRRAINRQPRIWYRK